jgi:hypothetical protein
MVDPTTDKLVDLRVAHLNMIQGIIGRMSGFSAAAKNFCVTISAVIIGFALQRQVAMLGYAVVAVIVIFYIMDTYYLVLEKRYRTLYEEVAARDFSDAAQLSLKPPSWSYDTITAAGCSTSVIIFYVIPLIGVVILLLVTSHEQPVRSEQFKRFAVSDCGSAGSAERPQVARVTNRGGADGCAKSKRPTGRIEPVLKSTGEADTGSNADGNVRL